MEIVRLVPPGRFPTVIHEPGDWHGVIGCRADCHLQSFSLNEAWWRIVCSPAAKALLLEDLPALERVRQRLHWRAAGLDLAASGRAASLALMEFRRDDSFAASGAYLRAAAALGEHCAGLDQAQRETQFLIEEGPWVRRLDYDESTALAGFARRPSFLRRLIANALTEAPEKIDLLIVTVTSPQDLLTAMIAVLLLKQRHPDLHACLADHGWENFSLTPHVEQLRRRGALDSVFDTILVSKDERDRLLPALIERIAAGERPRGYLRASEFASVPAPARSAPAPAPRLPTFTSEPILWMRLSSRRCYWSRCAFCTQNSKYDDPRAPSRSEIDNALDRVAVNLAAGYRQVIFSDEAVSPAFLRQLCEAVIARGMSFRWACRCKLELAFTPDLFRLMRRAGCYEVLYGLETISPRMQQRMDKYVEGLDRERIASIFAAASDAGLGLFVNLIGGFPGDTREELRSSVDFLIGVFRHADHATYVVNQFALFPDTPIAAAPERFGVALRPSAADMPARYPYTLIGEGAEETQLAHGLVPAMRRRLDSELGWAQLGSGSGGDAARILYFETGHGALLKARPQNPLANPLTCAERDLAGAVA